MAFSLRCPVCRVKFAWDVKAGWPDYCPNDACQSRIAHDRADDDIVIPFIRHTATKSTDQVYRDIESSSERRAEMAAAEAGISEGDVILGVNRARINSVAELQAAIRSSGRTAALLIQTTQGNSSQTRIVTVRLGN